MQTSRYRKFKSLFFTLLMASLFGFVTFTQSLAGNFAERKIFGFSNDGSQFAYEDYGSNDGTGYPYSNIYVLDTKTNQLVAGSPYRVLLEGISATEAQARAKARKLARHALKNITVPGFKAATIRYPQRPVEPTLLTAVPYPIQLYNPPTITLEIEQYDVAGGEKFQCDNPLQAYNLYLLPRSEGGTKSLLHTDGNSIPESRGCTSSYGFADLVTFPYAGDKPPTFIGVVLIRFIRRGFEGPDGRFTAVAFDALR